MAKQRKAPPGTYWRGQILWGRLVVKGREIRWSLDTSDVTIARSRYTIRRDKEIAAAKHGDERKEWGDVVLAWTDHIIGNVGPNTLKRYLVSLRMVTADLDGCYLDEIDARVIADLVKRRKKGTDLEKGGASNATIRRDLGAVSSVLGFAKDEGWIKENVAFDRLVRLKERRDPIVLPSLADIAFVVGRAPGLFATMIEVARLTGCRQEELVTLQRRHLDFERRQMTVIGKGNKLRTIDMLGAYDALSRLPVHLHSKWVFWHDDGLPYRNVASRFVAMTKSAHEAAQRSKRHFRPFRFHDLRHLFAVSYLKDRQGGLYELQRHLGHGSVTTTEGYLSYLTPEEAAAARGAHGTKSGTSAPVSRSAGAEI